MTVKDAHPMVHATNPGLRALVKQIAELIWQARAEQALLEDSQNLAGELDQRWQTIEQLADQLFDHRPGGLDEAAAQATVGLALSNAGNWDEDHALTAVARALATSGRSQRHHAGLSDAVARIAAASDAADPVPGDQDGP